MKFVIAPDSFKGSLSAKEVARAIAEGVHRVDQEIETILVPMADGGEGTVENLVDATNGQIYHVFVKDPLGRDIKAFYGILGDNETCAIETASASGLSLLSKKERNPMLTTSYGTGQLILHALDRGYRKFIIGLGGSATNDGGAGLVQALGVKLTDAKGSDIPFGGMNLHLINDIELSNLDSRIKDAEFTIACDVDNPFIGPNGASKVFGPQKGATQEMVEILDKNLFHFANIIKKRTNISIHNIPGAGAAGGLGGALLAFLNGKLEKGINITVKATELGKKLEGASLVITGEGQMDFQTAFGKTPIGVSKLAKKNEIPTVAIVGSVGKGIDKLRGFGIHGVLSIINKPMSLEEAMENSYELIVYTAEQLTRIYLLRTKSF